MKENNFFKKRKEKKSVQNLSKFRQWLQRSRRRFPASQLSLNLEGFLGCSRCHGTKISERNKKKKRNKEKKKKTTTKTLFPPKEKKKKKRRRRRKRRRRNRERENKEQHLRKSEKFLQEQGVSVPSPAPAEGAAGSIPLPAGKSCLDSPSFPRLSSSHQHQALQTPRGSQALSKMHQQGWGKKI